MKFKGNLIGALISLAIFLGCAIAGGICLAAGIGDLAQDPEIISSVESVFENIGDFDLNVNLTTETENATAHYTRQLSDDIDTISIATSCCAVDIARGDEFAVDFTGVVADGSFAVTNESTTGEGDELNADYYFNDGIINATLSGGALKINVKASAKVFGVSNSVGRITVTIPDSYTGSLELGDGVAEINVSGLSLNGLTLSNCLGETEITGCSIQMLTVTDLLGEVDTGNCSIYGVDFSNIMGEISVDTKDAFTGDSAIRDVMGEVSIDLPVGAQLNVHSSDILGQVSIDSRLTGEASAPALDISDIMGVVTVEIDAD